MTRKVIAIPPSVALLKFCGYKHKMISGIADQKEA